MTGVSTRELMTRMGHSSPRAALFYQHSTPERDAKIAAALSEQIKDHAERRSSEDRQISRSTTEVIYQE
jgi:hypothetical protein